MMWCEERLRRDKASIEYCIVRLGRLCEAHEGKTRRRAKLCIGQHLMGDPALEDMDRSAKTTRGDAADVCVAAMQAGICKNVTFELGSEKPFSPDDADAPAVVTAAFRHLDPSWDDNLVFELPNDDVEAPMEDEMI